jgi:amidophosphoribosyltransferase
MSGIFGVVSKKENCNQSLFYGTDYHSHLGTEYGGMVVMNDHFHHKIHSISQGQFKSKFAEENLKMEGRKGIGVISDSDVQPIFTHSKFGSFFLVTAGLIENKQELTEELLAKGITFSEYGRNGVNTTELIAKLKAANLSDDDLEWCLGKTAAEFFGLP